MDRFSDGEGVVVGWMVSSYIAHRYVSGHNGIPQDGCSHVNEPGESSSHGPGKLFALKIFRLSTCNYLWLLNTAAELS